MSKPEQKIMRIVEVPGIYGGGLAQVEVIENKGRLPKADRNGMSRRERRERKNMLTRPHLQGEMLNLAGNLEGMLFTFNPNESKK
ncbi:MAG: hypothetical protein ACM3IJ_01630 [Candidatus Levyibacteriota bacterium]